MTDAVLIANLKGRGYTDIAISYADRAKAVQARASDGNWRRSAVNGTGIDNAIIAQWFGL